MTSQKRAGLIWVLLCTGISVLWGTAIARGGNAWIDFRAVYAGTRCLIHRHNPYRVGELEREYASEDGQRPPRTPDYLQGVTLYVNVPTTFLVVAPFALLGWGPAHALWMLLTGGVFILAILLMWSAGSSYAPRVATCLACIVAVSCESIFAAGNTAGLVVGLCGIAVWCFLENRWVRAGVICLAIALAIKPHDAGLVWLYFLLAGGVNRRRALRSLWITAALGLAAGVWVSAVAPGWAHDWSANLATISAPGGINNPAPDSFSGHSVYMVVDLQAAISVFRDNPRLYNPVSYLLCGTLLLVWSIWTLRTGFSVRRAWMALPVAIALSLLITYHRPWDAKLVILAIPACCMLGAAGGRVAREALAITIAATLFAGEIALSVFKTIADGLRLGTAGFGHQLLTVILIRPESIALLAMGIFYLSLYLKEGTLRGKTAHCDAIASMAGC